MEASIRGNPVAQVSKWVGKFSNPLTTNGSFLKSAQVERNEILFYSEFVPALLTFLRGDFFLQGEGRGCDQGSRGQSGEL